MKITVLIPYFGKWPPWIEYFLHSCRHNPEMEFLLFSDAGRPEHCPPNVRYRQSSLGEFSEIAGAGLGMPIKLVHPYKICDFRPAFGRIFSEHLKNADFWGYSDLDLIFGRAARFLTPEILDRYDVISVRRDYLAGHFALFRNSDLLNGLYSRSPVHRKVLTDGDRHYAFDERSNIYGRRLTLKHHKGNKGEDRKGTFPRRESHVNLRYPGERAIKGSLNRIKYRLGINLPAGPADMNSIVNQAEKRGEIRVFRKDLVRSDLWYAKNGIGDWQVIWREGTLSSLPEKHELLHFHFLGSKKNKNFSVEPSRDSSVFMITAGGIRPVQ